MTIALSPRCTHAVRRFARFSSTARGVVASFPVRRPAPQPTVNAGRWAMLPGEDSGLWQRPLEQALPPMFAPGMTVSVSCADRGPVILHLGGAWRGRVVFEGSMDGARWLPLPLVSFTGDLGGSETDRPGLWRSLPGQPVNYIRLRVAELSAGTVRAMIAAAPAVHHRMGEPLDSAA